MRGHSQIKGRLFKPSAVLGISLCLLVAGSTLLFAAVHNWPFAVGDNYTFDDTKIEFKGDVAALRAITVLHEKEKDFAGTHSKTVWDTDHLQLDNTGLADGWGVYTSQVIDSGLAEAQWGRIGWTEIVSQGKASFEVSKSVGQSSTGYSAYGVDIDGDDDIDLPAVQDKSPRTRYFENDGSEGFTARTINNGQLKDPRGIQAADINGDSLVDVIVVAKSDLAWFENLGGTPANWKKWDIAPNPSDGLELEVADVNGDGFVDVVVGEGSKLKWYGSDGGNPPQWTLAEVDTALSAVDALSIADLDGDGDMDLLAGDSGGLYWYENDGSNSAQFTKRVIDATVINGESLIAADLNGDKRVDVVAVGRNNISLHWYDNDGISPPGFTKRSVDAGPIVGPVSVAVGDLDRDGDMDLVLVDGGSLHWYENQGGVFPSWNKTTIASGSLAGADHVFLINMEDDAEGDDDLDIVVAQKAQVSWWENLLPHSNVRFQLRTSEDNVDWSDWQGPGGRSTSSYTEPAGSDVSVPNGRYIQYRAMLRTHNGNSLNPQVSMVRLELADTRYPTDNPTVQNNSGQDFSSLTSFAETLGAGHTGLVKYQISNNGTIWYYHNGSLWVPAAQGITHANTADEVNNEISTFSSDVGPGTFYFKAFLNSNGAQQVELDQVDVDLSTGGTAGGSGGSSGSGNSGGSSGSGGGSGSGSSGEGGSDGAPMIQMAWLSASETANGSNINQKPGVPLAWNLSVYDDAYFHHSPEINPERLVIKTPGDYLVALTLPMSGSADRTAVQAELRVNGLPHDGGIGRSSYIRNASGHNESSTHLAVMITDLSVDDYVEVFVKQTAATGSVDITGQAGLFVEYVPGTRSVFSATATRTTSSTNLNQTSAYNLEWSEKRKSPGFTHSDSANPENITVEQAGNYLVFVNIPLAGNLTRGNVKLLVQDDGVVVPGGEGKQGYIRNASGHNQSSIHWSGLVTNVEAGSVLSISTQREGAAGTVTIPAGEVATVYLEKVDSAKNVFFSRGDSLTGGDNWNPNVKQWVKWGNNEIIDPALFAHSTITESHEVTVNQAGDYLLIYNDSLAASGARPNVRITVEVNGAARNGAETKSHYIRGASGHTESSGSLVYLLRDLASGDVVTIAAVAEAGIATVNDDHDALMMLWFKSDVVAPALASAAVNGNSLELSYTDTSGLDTTSVPVSEDFSVGSDGLQQTVSEVTITATKVTLTLAPGVGSSDSVTVTYTAGANRIQDRAGNPAAPLINEPISNATPRLVFVTQPGDGPAGLPLSPQPVVEIQDQAGNPITTDPNNGTTESVTLSIALGSNEEQAALSGSLTADIEWSTGRATFNNLSIDLVGRYQFTATTNFVASKRDSSEFSIAPGVGTQLSFGIEPSHASSMQAIAPGIKVQVLDAGGNLVTTANDSITLALNGNPGNGTLSGTLTATAVNGEATFSNISIDKAGAGYSLNAVAAGLTMVTSMSFDITAGPPTQLAYRTEPGDIVSMAAISPAIKVQVLDAGGNLVTTANNSITLAMNGNPSGGTLSGSLTMVPVNGEATFSNISIDKAGTGYVLDAVASGLSMATSGSFNVTAGAATQLVYSGEPSHTHAAATVSPAIKVRVFDAGGNLVTTATNPITLGLGNNPGSGTLAGTLTVPAVAGEAIFDDLSIDKAGSGYTLEAAASGLSSATSTGFDIIVGSAAILAYRVEPTNAVATEPIAPAIVVQIQDAGGNLVKTAAASVTLELNNNPGSGSLSGALTMAASGGEAIFNDVSIDKYGSGYSLRASAENLRPVISNDFNVVASDEPIRLAFIVQPTDSISQAALSPAVVVQVQDAGGNAIDSATNSISLGIENNPAGGKLSGTLTVTAVNGRATFNDIWIDKAGNGYSLSASASGLTSGKSGAFSIASGDPSQLVFNVQPSHAQSLSPIHPAVVIQIQDAAGNRIESATHPVTLEIGQNQVQGTLGGTLTQSALGGEAIFEDLTLDKAGVGYSLTVSTPGLKSATSKEFDVSPNAAARVVFITQPSHGTSGSVISPPITLQVQDSFGNHVSDATNPITLSFYGNAKDATLSGTLTENAVNGIARFSDISVDKAGAGYSLEAFAFGLDSSVSSHFNIMAGKGSRMVFAVEPSSSNVQIPMTPSIVVEIYDTGDNPVALQLPVTLALGNTPNAAVLSGTATVLSTAGKAIFTDISINQAGDGYTLVASSPGLPSVTSRTFSINDAPNLASDNRRPVLAPYRIVSLGASLDTVQEAEGVGQIDAGNRESLPANERAVESVLTDKPLPAAQDLPPEVNLSGSGHQRPAARTDFTGGVLNRDTMVIGASITIRYRADSGLSPELDVYDPRYTRLIKAAKMKEIGSSGIYEYKLRIPSQWGLGEFTVIASESTGGALDWMTLTVVAAAGPDVNHVKTENTASVPALLAAAASKLESVDADLKSSVIANVGFEDKGEMVPLVDSGDEEVKRIQNNLREISRMLEPVSDQNGIDLKLMYNSIKGDSADIQEIRKKADQLKMLIELNQEVINQAGDQSRAPITKTWYESGSVILKILVVNPSPTETQTVPVKIYLPKEVTPKDILDLQDLELDYDEENKTYFAHKAVELEPGQSITKMVRMVDIWAFPENELQALVDRAKEVAGRLASTVFTEEAAAFVHAVESKVFEILERQKLTASNAGEHIRAYREGLLTLASIRRDFLVLARYEQKAAAQRETEKHDLIQKSEHDIQQTEEISIEDEGQAFRTED